MPYSRSFSSSTDTLPLNFLVRNPFLIARLVFLALFSNFAVLSLIFSAWNIHMTQTAARTRTTPVTSVLIIVQSCLVFIGVGGILVDMFVRRVKASRIGFECAGVGVMSLVQVGVAVSATVNGPPSYCTTNNPWVVCASSTLLVPMTWLTSVLSLSYFLLLLVMTMTHRYFYADIWKRSVVDIEWFSIRNPRILNDKSIENFMTKRELSGLPYDLYDDVHSEGGQVEGGSQKGSPGRLDLDLKPESMQHENRPWVPRIRRGVDHPFGGERAAADMSLRPLSPEPIPPPLPAKPSPRGRETTRFVETFPVTPRESLLVATATATTISTGNPKNKSQKAPAIPDLDLPISLGRLSEWVRADALRGVNHPQKTVVSTR